MKEIFYKLFQNLRDIFSGKNLLWHLIMIAITAVIVLSGFDWWYFSATRGSILNTIGFSAALGGFLVPILIPLVLYFVSASTGKKHLKNAANASIQAGLLGLGISSLYKVFTGRVGLPHVMQVIDTSHVFRFGILRGGAFQGWPSSHTAVAFAMSVAIVSLYPKNKYVKYIAIAYALFVGLGVSVTIHWFSDFVAGMILGTVIGLVVGKRFLEKIQMEL